MICESKFRPGDKVAVVKNTERIPQASCIGMVGEVVGNCSRDCLVRFVDGSVHAIFEDDLETYNSSTTFPWADAVTIGDTPVELRRHICRLCGWEWYEACDNADYPYYCPGCGKEYVIGKDEGV